MFVACRVQTLCSKACRRFICFVWLGFWCGRSVGIRLGGLVVHFTGLIRLEVLTYVLERQEALMYLSGDPDLIKDGHEMSEKDVAVLTEITDVNPERRGLWFWAMCSAVFPLCATGGKIRAWLQGCSCHVSGDKAASDCPMKGRRSFELACGKMQEFVSWVAGTQVERNGFYNLERAGPVLSNNILLEFNAAKARIQFRVQMGFAFWEKFPWVVLSIRRPLLCKEGTQEHADATRWVQEHIPYLLNKYVEGLSSPTGYVRAGNVAHLLLGKGPIRQRSGQRSAFTQDRTNAESVVSGTVGLWKCIDLHGAA